MNLVELILVLLEDRYEDLMKRGVVINQVRFVIINLFMLIIEYANVL